MKLGYRLYTFVGCILNFHQATHKSLIQSESYQKFSEKTKNNGEWINSLINSLINS